MFKYYVMSLMIALSLSLSGCSSNPPEVIYKERIIFAELGEELFTPCNKPTTIAYDLPELDVTKNPKDLEIPELKLLGVYANAKIEHLACYDSIVNIWETQKRIIEKRKKLEIEQGRGQLDETSRVIINYSK